MFSAHGVSPAVREEADARNLEVIDATCPFVTKVHHEVRRYAKKAYTVLLIGHRRHDEIEGIVGEAPGNVRVLESPEEAREVHVADPERVAVMTQTTLSVTDTADVIDILRARFPAIEAPPKSDICYATHNRQRAVRHLARLCDLILVLGARNSSNTNRLAEVAAACGANVRLVTAISDLPTSTVENAQIIGISAGASTPESFVTQVVHYIGENWPISTQEVSVVEEDVHFRVPAKLRER